MKTLSMLSLLGFTVLTAFAPDASAVRTGVTLTIGDITIEGTERARIYVPGLSGTAPACGSSRPHHFSMDQTTNKGRAQLDLATAAMLSGKPVHVHGLDTCLTILNTAYQQLGQLTLNP